LKIAYLYQSDNQQPEEKPQYPDSKLAIIELKKYLNQMPGEWIDQLHKTAYIGDDNIIFKLLAQIPPEYSELTKALADFTHNFEFDKIIELTQT
ncbi:MAG TPA: hybrid sensor histidine kinase/response regulator, partial [Cyanobacteria bacterium UBA11371]|nr:hybrid sensor histidine kinase/response regulator [Cyanobacteria bacterium UBA11371]